MEEFASLLALIYDTVLDEGRWNDALLGIASFVRCTHAALVVEDSDRPESSLIVIAPDNPALIARYVAEFMLINPMRLATIETVTAGDVVLTPDFMTVRQYRQTRFYREFLSPAGLVDIAASVLEKTPVTIAVLSLLFGPADGPATPGTRTRIMQLAPHVRRAASAGQMLLRERERASSTSRLLDRVQGAVVLLDEHGAVLHSNAAAQAELEVGTGMRLVNGRLVLRELGARAYLQTALRASASGDAAMVGVPSAIIIACSDQRSLSGLVVPLMGGDRRAMLTHRPCVAALFVRNAAPQTPLAVGTLKDRYGLTARETAVLVCMAESGGAAEVAAILGMSELTVRTHVRSIYRKTNASRQADLVRLVSGVATPFG